MPGIKIGTETGKFVSKFQKLVLTSLLLISVPLSFSAPAHASKTKTLEIENVAILKFPSSIKLAPQGCQSVPVSYEITGPLQEFDTLYVNLEDETGEIFGEQTLYQTPAVSEWMEFRSYKKKSSASIKICKKTRYFDMGEWVEQLIGARKGEVVVRFWSSFSGEPTLSFMKFR
jgi:hypothetical protein